MSGSHEGNSTIQNVRTTAARRGLVMFFLSLATVIGIFFAGFYIGHLTLHFPVPPIVNAEITGKCKDGSKITASTGNTSGRCVVSKNSDGSANTVGCDDLHGNSATGECNASGAQCGGSSGSGKCSL